MIELRRDFALVWLPTGLLVATGGFQGGFDSISSVETLQLPWNATFTPSGSWRPAASMFFARKNHAATVFQASR